MKDPTLASHNTTMNRLCHIQRNAFGRLRSLQFVHSRGLNTDTPAPRTLPSFSLQDKVSSRCDNICPKMGSSLLDPLNGFAGMYGNRSSPRSWIRVLRCLRSVVSSFVDAPLTEFIPSNRGCTSLALLDLNNEELTRATFLVETHARKFFEQQHSGCTNEVTFSSR